MAGELRHDRGRRIAGYDIESIHLRGDGDARLVVVMPPRHKKGLARSGEADVQRLRLTLPAPHSSSPWPVAPFRFRDSPGGDWLTRDGVTAFRLFPHFRE